jgi:hypothetical protein
MKSEPFPPVKSWPLRNTINDEAGEGECESLNVLLRPSLSPKSVSFIESATPSPPRRFEILSSKEEIEPERDDRVPETALILLSSELDSPLIVETRELEACVTLLSRDDEVFVTKESKLPKLLARLLVAVWTLLTVVCSDVIEVFNDPRFEAKELTVVARLDTCEERELTRPGTAANSADSELVSASALTLMLPSSLLTIVTLLPALMVGEPDGRVNTPSQPPWKQEFP